MVKQIHFSGLCESWEFLHAGGAGPCEGRDWGVGGGFGSETPQGRQNQK